MRSQGLRGRGKAKKSLTTYVASNQTGCLKMSSALFQASRLYMIHKEEHRTKRALYLTAKHWKEPKHHYRSVFSYVVLSFEAWHLGVVCALSVGVSELHHVVSALHHWIL